MTLRKVIWAEGILLGQQHFQQWEHYYEQLQRNYSNAYLENNWGLVELAIDEAALLNAQFKIKQVKAILPNKQWIEFHNKEGHLLNYTLPPSEGKTINIYLGMADNQQVSGITGYENKTALASWQGEYVSMQDQYDVKRHREVLVGRCQLVLLSDHDTREYFQQIKIAELITAPQGGFKLKDNFVPTVLKVQASTYLVDWLGSITELIYAKIRLLQTLRQQWQQQSHLLNQQQINCNTILSALVRYYPVLRQWQKQQQTHPQRIYEVLVTLLAELISLTERATLADIPLYQHLDLTNTFLNLEKLILPLLEKINPVPTQSLQLQRIGETLYGVRDIPKEMFTRTQFYFAVAFASQNLEWINQFFRQIKVGSLQAIDSIITAALPGVPVTHVHRPPSQLTLRPGYEYFHLEPVGHFWERIKEDKSLGVFVPNYFIEAQIELIALQE